MSTGFRGDARLYRMERPVSYTDWSSDEEVVKKTFYVIVSRVSDGYVDETLIFPATEDGEVIDWSELEGSCRHHSINHERALRGLHA